MEENVKILKLINATDAEFEEIISEVKSIKGVLDSIIENNNGNILLKDAIDEWSSDYDILVKVMDILTDRFSIDSEFYNEDEEKENDDDFFIIKEENSCDSCEDDHKHHHTHSRSEGSSCGCGDSHSEGSSCGCGHEHSEVNKKSKMIELSISFIILITGIILSSFDATKTASSYFFVISYAIAGYEVLFEGLIKIFKGKVFSEDLLMSIASLSAILLGEFVESAGIMILFSLGELFEHSASDNARKVIDSLKDISPKTANVIDENGDIKKTKVEDIKVGDIVLIKAGERIVVDGVIIEGSCSLDTKTITGESNYKDALVGDKVYGGYLSVDGSVKVRVEKPFNESTLQVIVDIVEKSAIKKSKKEKFIEKFSKIYTPIVVVVALIVAFIPPIFSASYSAGLSVWGVRAVMLLCISCPCSVVISIPLTYFCGVGMLAKWGVVVKNTETLEKLSSCDTVVFDKTGTLTKGDLKVTKIISTKEYKGRLLSLVCIAEQYSNHPVAKACLNAFNGVVEKGKNFKEIAGKGVEVDFEKNHIICGNLAFLQEQNIEVKTTNEVGVKLYVAINNEYAGCLVLSDIIKDEAHGAILELYDAGILNTVMLTGDNKEYAIKVRKELGIKQSVSELLPQDKVEELERIIAEKGKSSVAYVGDGINDAPVITRSDVGYAMGAIGSESAIQCADIIITDDDLSKIPLSVKLAKRTNAIAKQNIILSLAVKFVVMLLATTGLFTSLWLAISADVGIMVIAVLNAIRNRNTIL